MLHLEYTGENIAVLNDADNVVFTGEGRWIKGVISAMDDFTRTSTTLSFGDEVLALNGYSSEYTVGDVVRVHITDLCFNSFDRMESVV